MKLRERSLGIYSDLVHSSLNQPYVAAAGSFLTAKALTGTVYYVEGGGLLRLERGGGGLSCFLLQRHSQVLCIM